MTLFVPLVIHHLSFGSDFHTWHLVNFFSNYPSLLPYDTELYFSCFVWLLLEKMGGKAGVWHNMHLWSASNVPSTQSYIRWKTMNKLWPLPRKACKTRRRQKAKQKISIPRIFYFLEHRERWRKNNGEKRRSSSIVTEYPHVVKSRLLPIRNLTVHLYLHEFCFQIIHCFSCFSHTRWPPLSLIDWRLEFSIMQT